jgi:hypothetical protein
MRIFMFRGLASTFLGTLLLVFALLASGCQEERASGSGKGKSEGTEKSAQREEFPNGHYWFNVKVDQFKGSYTLLCNGFPVKRMWVNIIETDDEWAADMQTALVGEGNMASIRIRPFLDYSGKRLSVGTAQLKAWVEIEETRQSYVPLHEIKGAEGEGRLRAEAVDSAYSAWEKQVQRQWKKLLNQKSTTKEAFVQLKTWRWNHPMEVQTTPFTNRGGPDFSRIFEEAPRLPDRPATRERLRDYAMRLRNLLRTGDAEGIYRQIRPSISEETGWFKVTRSGRRDSALAQIQEEWVQDFRTDFSRSDVRLRRWSEGRVWELSVLRPEEGRRPFFSEGPHSSYLKVYVAEIDGQLRVVRLTA